MSNPTDTGADQRRMVRALKARIKALEGEHVTRQDDKDIAWLAKIDRQATLEQLIHNFPKGVYCTLSSRQQKVIDEQAIRYQLPLRGETLDLGQVLTAFHDFLSSNAKRLGDSTSGGNDRDSLELEKLRVQISQMQHRTELIKLDFAQASANTIHRHEVRERLQWLATQLRGFGQYLQRTFGDAAVKALNETLDKIEREILVGELSMEPPIE